VEATSKPVLIFSCSILFTGLFFLTTDVMAQKEFNYWCWGTGQGLNFNITDPATGYPVSDTCAIPARHEGTASLCNSNGELKIYTDGMTVFNCCHQIMQNGTGLNGHNSSTESAIIVPDLNDNGRCFIFTTDAMEPGGCDCLSYSVADLNANNGLGAVVLKNVVLWTPVLEKLTAIKHANGRDVWVVAHEWDSNRFLAFLLTSSGLNTTPVISSAGVVHTGYGYGSPGNNHAVGYMKASSNGKKLGCAIANQGGFQLFDFDNSTGIVSNPLTFTNNNVTRSIFDDSYGVEFSPDNSKLYVRTLGGTSGGGIVQVNLNAGSNAAIVSSATNIYPANTVMSGIQLGPDGRIYVGGTAQFIGVINFPNLSGLNCSYTPAAIKVRSTAVGLPQTIVAPFSFSGSCSCNMAVSLDWMRFDCHRAGNEVVLRWTTSIPAGPGYFGIEKSSDGINFEQIGKTGSDPGSANHYTYTDKSPCTGGCYYRVKYSGTGGKISYSEIRSVHLPGAEAGQLKFFPNPVKAGVNALVKVEIPHSGPFKIRITDVLGRELYYTESISENKNGTVDLTVPHLYPGLYFIHLVAGSSVTTARVIAGE
jgi:hypothetical protein